MDLALLGNVLIIEASWCLVGSAIFCIFWSRSRMRALREQLLTDDAPTAGDPSTQLESLT